MMQKKLVLFGAGKIGRSFIGQLFSRGGYEVVFVDINKLVIDELNAKGFYKVLIKDVVETVILVEHVRGVYLSDEEVVVKEILNADFIAVSVGQKGLPETIALIARGLVERFNISKYSAIDIIIAENLRDAANYMESELKKYLPHEYPINELVGLVETSIGKMVPIMKKSDLQKDPLLIFAESYNTLILDKKAFRNPIPEIVGLAPKENMKAWVDRKLFIHNLGHAAIAYLGYYYDPRFKYIYQVLEEQKLLAEVRKVMKQSAVALLRKYPDEFTEDSLNDHIEDLLRRFANRALGDTIFRVGCDLRRKLGPEDRLVGAIRMAIEMNVPYELILRILICACHFEAKDEDGNMLPEDIDFAKIQKKGIRELLIHVCEFDLNSDQLLILQAENINRSICGLV